MGSADLIVLGRLQRKGFCKGLVHPPECQRPKDKIKNQLGNPRNRLQNGAQNFKANSDPGAKKKQNIDPQSPQGEKRAPRRLSDSPAFKNGSECHVGNHAAGQNP
nr:hypothetical protein BdHM001_36360 [Bdellovibrio sp. HM001]